jgi:hypothetical protein
MKMGKLKELCKIGSIIFGGMFLQATLINKIISFPYLFIFLIFFALYLFSKLKTK